MSSNRFAPSFGRLALRLALLSSTIVAGAAVPIAAQAQNAPSSTAQARAGEVQFNVPPQSLDSALTRVADQGGIRIFFTSAELSGLSTNGVTGTMTVEQALSQVLTGSGFGWRYREAGTVVIEKLPVTQGAIQLGPVRVEGTSSAEQGSYSDGYDPNESDPYAKMINPPSGVASKEPLTQREIPQSVTVMTQEQIQQLNATSLDDAMRHMPGVFVQKADGERTAYLSRGFGVGGFQIDGVPITTGLLANVPDLTAYDRVELLRGPAGLLSTVGSPGGAINLVLKKPTREFAASAELSGGSYSNYREQVDLSGPLNKSGSLRARVVQALATDDTPRHGAFRNNISLYGVIEYDASSTTLLRAGINYHRLKNRDQYDGYPAYSNYELIPNLTHVYLGSDWGRNTSTTTNPFVEVEQKVGSWNLNLRVNANEYKQFMIRSSISSSVDPATNMSKARSIYLGPANSKGLNIDAYVTGPVHLPWMEATVTAGVNYVRDDLHQSNTYVSLSDLFATVPVNIFDYHVTEPDFSGPLLLRKTVTNQYGVYANGRVKPVNWLTLIAGGRFSWWEQTYTPGPNSFTLNTPTHDTINGHFIPYGGAIIDVDRHHSLYASYSSIFKPQSARDLDGKLIKPLQGRQFEIGVKGEYLAGRLNASLALFQLTQANQAIQYPSDPLGRAYPDGKSRGRGIEATLSGKVTSNWEIDASYTYTTTKYLDEVELATPGRFGSSFAPKNMFRLWTNYTLPGELRAWSLGGGITATSKTYIDNGVGRVTQDGYATFDARVAYQVSEHLTASVNVTNITNKYYFERLGGTSGGNWLGDPREVMFTLRANY